MRMISFVEETVTAEEELLSKVSENPKQQWLKTVGKVNMTWNGCHTAKYMKSVSCPTADTRIVV